MNEKILLLDADSLIYICSCKDTLPECIEEFDKRFKGILKATEVTSYLGFITLPQNFRYTIADGYKANRSSSKAPKWLKALKEYTKEEYGFYGIQGLEADDLVGLAKTHFNNLNIESVIGAIDKDVLKQIPGIHFNYQLDKDTLDFKGWVTTTGKEALEFLFLQSITGDSVDGIKGLSGYGPVKTLAYLNSKECVDFEDYFSACIVKYSEVYKNYIFGFKEFSKQFRLIYILRTSDDLLFELGYKDLSFIPIDLLQSTSNNKVEW